MGDTLSNPPIQTQEHDAYSHDDRSRAPAGSGMPDSGPYQSQFNVSSQQLRQDPSRQQATVGSYQTQPHQSQSGPFNLGSMAGALSDFVSTQQGQRIQGVPQTSHRGMHYPSASPYGTGYATAQFPGTSIDTSLDGTAGQQSQRHGSLGTAPSPYSPYGQQMPQYYYPNTQFSPTGQQAFFAGAGQTMPAYDRRTSASLQGMQPGYGGNYPNQGLGRAVPGLGAYGYPYTAGEEAVQQRRPSSSSASTVPRGPPRKPKQSGHALWVGNLPPGTTVLDLKDHFSRDATKDIESLFLISKSNCAFVNYRTEASCMAAMQRFHDSRFHEVRLVCRLRRSSATPTGTPSGPSAMAGSAAAPEGISPSAQAPPITVGAEVSPAEPETVASNSGPPELAPGEKVQDKFFVVKSLTLQDLELSVRNGIWATQSHNEETLNKAYESAENVYLIFSANKSGEYFGYARMTSSISEDAKQIFGTIPRHEPTVDAADAPRTIPTPATEFAPRGHIIDDSARGTIFWEADHSDDETEEEPKPLAATEVADDEAASGSQSWGKPFKIEWVSTNRLPFYRTRGLRNPWNANREVKIARDGTELEPSVGNRLIQMFHRLGQPPGAQITAQMGGHTMRPYV